MRNPMQYLLNSKPMAIGSRHLFPNGRRRSRGCTRALATRRQPTSFDKSSVTLTGQWSLPITSAWISAACTAGRSAGDTNT